MTAQRGMTLAEVLACMTIIAITMPVMLGAVSLANRTAVVAERRVEAAFRADQLLQEAVASGSWEDGEASGVLENGSTWERTVEDWEQEAMSAVTVSVVYTVQGRQYTERVTRLVTATEEAE